MDNQLPMTRIDFHSNVGNQLDYACRLTRKALHAGCRIVVRHQDATQQAQFDDLLWSFSDTDFLPHVAIDDPLAAHTPVLLSLDDQTAGVDQLAATGHNQILLNLSDTVPADFTQFERLIEIVPAAPEATQAGRERYRHYQKQGYPLNHINAK